MTFSEMTTSVDYYLFGATKSSSCSHVTRAGHPCKAFTIAPDPVCWVHASEEQRAAYERWKEDREAQMTAHLRFVNPACWSWPVTPEDAAEAQRDWSYIAEWQRGRCAICGGDKTGVVLDHDHMTGWIRGLLCGSCNRREPGGTLRKFRRYRKWNPARMLGFWDRYWQWARGEDFGWINGVGKTTRPHPVDSHGVIYIDWDTDESPLEAVARSFAPSADGGGDDAR